MKRLLLLPLFLFADEFDFNVEEFEKKNYEIVNYIKFDYIKNNKDTLKEGEFNSKGNYKNLFFNYSFYNIDGDKKGLLNEGYLKFGSETEFVNLGKKLIKWGKGYSYNAVSFFSLPKDPLYPEDLKEGFVVIDFNKINPSNSYEFVYLKADKNLNHKYPKSQNFGGKIYCLVNNVDIDFLFNISDKKENSKIGADFSTNISPELEIHSEYARNEDNFSYLLGLKYAWLYDLTFTVEEYRKWNKTNNFYFKISQKDTFSIPYLTLYGVYLKNQTFNRYQNLIGASYKYKENWVFTLETLKSSIYKYQIKGEISFYF